MLHLAVAVARLLKANASAHQWQGTVPVGPQKDAKGKGPFTNSLHLAVVVAMGTSSCHLELVVARGTEHHAKRMWPLSAGCH